MVRVVKHQANNRLFDYEFVDFDYWEDFDVLSTILINHMGSNIKERLDGIYSRFLKLEKEGHLFTLMYHEDTGNSICPTSNEQTHLLFIEDLANKMLPLINESVNNHDFYFNKE